MGRFIIGGYSFMGDRSKSRILIADPDPDIRETLQLYFKSNGHEVKTVFLVKDVLRAARPWQPHAILISTEFEDANPHDICRELLDDTLTGHIPLLIMLHLNERRARLQALEVGVGDIITKPFDIEELLLRVEAAIRLSTERFGKSFV
jgi:DNA-binding response OmpR family regulator